MLSASDGTSASSAVMEFQRKSGARARMASRNRTDDIGRRMASLMSVLRKPASMKMLTSRSSRMAKQEVE
ncbi:hypothetical protein PR202_ga10261 [Eleusine coracana subsp. coracana]|uniref:Uncharacterized protein n=1 Tax=Eleusine coracana subsp. coracana TaxID=191504 RepID=A0AAV5C691_ELECO|nr:hypothetical protein PR202_ga10261 [Eleusine coracana subsp. coracana]